MARIIGGMFGLEATPSPGGMAPPFLTERSILTVNARSGIWLVVRHLSPRYVWMPSYLCPSMLDAVDQSVARIRFYEVNDDLLVRSWEWLDSVRPQDLVIFIDYFGFTCHPGLPVRARERGAIVLEDACQAMLSGRVGQFSDFTLFSPRKFLGIPDGGLLALNCQFDLHAVDLVAPPAEWWLRAFAASVMRREFDLYGGSRHWFGLFQRTESESPIGLYAMSELSRTILLNGFDYSAIAQRRRANYRVLASTLDHLALFPELPGHVVPLGFPIRIRDRDQIRQTLFDQEIYPPVHWSLGGAVPEHYRGSHQLSTEIMTLPCDQRYDTADMQRMAQLVQGALR